MGTKYLFKFHGSLVGSCKVLHAEVLTSKMSSEVSLFFNLI